MYAFRYALGRRTYAVSDVADALIEHAGTLRPDWQVQIVERIDEAISDGSAGDAMDVERWREVQRVMRSSLGDGSPESAGAGAGRGREMDAKVSPSGS
jgi:hypothetical protein